MNRYISYIALFVQLSTINAFVYNNSLNKTIELPTLSQLALQYHCEKGPQAFDYTETYEYYFTPLRDKPITFLEINAGYGAFFSRKMWDSYFIHPHASLYFISPSVDPIPPYHQHYLNRTDSLQLSARTALQKLNLSDQHLVAAFAQANGSFDIIIDDGFHKPEEQVANFKTLFPSLKPGGIYVIEDVFTSYSQCEPLIDQRSHNDILTLFNHSQLQDNENNLLHNSTVHFLKELVDDINYTPAKSPLNYNAAYTPIPYDYMKQWANVIKKTTEEHKKEIKSIHFYSNLCIIIKDNKPLRQHFSPHPIGYCLPESKMVKEIPTKERDFAFIVPGDLKTYIYDNEADYYKDYQRSLYAITTCKVGWDCLRHYEILANGCIPYFTDLEKCHPNTMHFLPKKLILEAMNLPGVSYLKIDHTKFDRAKYDELLRKILAHTHKHLTTQSMARHILKTINYSGSGSILFLFEPKWPTDYTRDLILAGLKEELGDKVIDFPKSEIIYKSYPWDTKQLYGKGFSYTKIVDDIPVNRSNIQQRIKNKEFECIIYGYIHQQLPFYDLVCSNYEPEKIAYLCGAERYSGAPHTHHCGYRGILKNVFVREWAPDMYYNKPSY